MILFYCYENGNSIFGAKGESSVKLLANRVLLIDGERKFDTSGGTITVQSNSRDDLKFVDISANGGVKEEIKDNYYTLFY